MSHDPTSLAELGQKLRAARDFAAAEPIYRELVARQPDDLAARVYWSRTLRELQRDDEATAVLRQLPGCRPTSPESYRLAFLELHRHALHDEARELAECWREAAPQDPLARHYAQAYSGVAEDPRASDDYVRATFDSFAASYDGVLARIRYRAPEILEAALRPHLPAESGLAILDAGCGTGLCGPWLRPLAARLVGLDLSPAMLSRAAARGCYDELFERELTAFLAQTDETFDLIVFADTLVYFGDLLPVLALVSRVLRPEGVCVFSAERWDAPAEAEFRLNPSGRYAHAPAYLERVVDRAGLHLLVAATESLRIEQDEPVLCQVIVARNAPAKTRAREADVALRLMQATVDPHDARAQFDFGLACTAMNRHEEARNAFCRVIELRPDVEPAHFNLGNACVALGRWDEAAAAFLAALALADEAATHTNLGNVYACQRRWDDAERCYQTALQVDPEFANARNNLSRLAEERTREGDARP